MSSTARALVAGALLCAALALAACGEDERQPAGDGAQRPPAARRALGSLPPAPVGIRLTSSAFGPGRPIPRRFTCDGEGPSPPLAWSRIPANTRQLVLMVEDPDAPRRPFVHWVVLGLGADSRGLAAGAKPTTLRLGRASSGKVGWVPPCPPRGAPPHRYVFALYALRRPLALAYGAPAAAVRDALATGRPLARGTLVGRYGR